jgi:hypothetical protein
MRVRTTHLPNFALFQQIAGGRAYRIGFDLDNNASRIKKLMLFMNPLSRAVVCVKEHYW